MESLAPKGLGQNCAKTFLHVAASVMRCECVVAEITRAEYAAYNLIDVDNSSQLATLSAYPVAQMCFLAQALQIRIKFLYCFRRRCPTSVQFLAPSHGLEKLIASFSRRFHQNGVLIHLPSSSWFLMVGSA